MWLLTSVDRRFFRLKMEAFFPFSQGPTPRQLRAAEGGGLASPEDEASGYTIESDHPRIHMHTMMKVDSIL